MKWLVRSLIGIASLILVALIGFQVFRIQIAEAAFRNAVEANVGRDASAELPDGLHVFMCGAGTPLPDPMRAGPCLGLIAGDRAFVFDAGSGGTRNLSRMRFPLGRTERVYLTHLHSDHMDGLGELLMQAWVNGQRTAPSPDRAGSMKLSMASTPPTGSTVHSGPRITAPQLPIPPAGAARGKPSRCLQAPVQDRSSSMMAG